MFRRKCHAQRIIRPDPQKKPSPLEQEDGIVRPSQFSEALNCLTAILRILFENTLRASGSPHVIGLHDRLAPPEHLFPLQNVEILKSLKSKRSNPKKNLICKADQLPYIFTFTIIKNNSNSKFEVSKLFAYFRLNKQIKNNKWIQNSSENSGNF